MTQFDLYKNNDNDTNKTYPYFVDIQNELLGTLNSRVVVPLTPATLIENKALVNLCPFINMDEGDIAFLTHQMSSVPNTLLTVPATNLAAFRGQIINAIDFLIYGI